MHIINVLPLDSTHLWSIIGTLFRIAEWFFFLDC